MRARVVPRQVYQEEEEDEEEDYEVEPSVIAQAPLRRHSAPTPDGKEEIKRG